MSENLNAETQAFERFSKLTAHIERMAHTGRTGSMGEWSDFLQSLNAALPRALSPASAGMGEALAGLPDNCDGKEQLAFEEWAKSKHYDMQEHPLHYLFLDTKTAAARYGWNAAITYCRKQVKAALLASQAPGSEPQAEETVCTRCHGTGNDQYASSDRKKCPDCGGKGHTLSALSKREARSPSQSSEKET